MATNLFQMVSAITKEVLNDKIMKFAYEKSPLFRRIFPDSKGVFFDDKIGRNWKGIQTFRTGMAGGTKWIGVPGAGSTNLNNIGSTTNSQINLYGANILYPNRNQAPTPGYGQIVYQMKQMLGNLYVPLELVQMAELGASIGEQLAATIEGTAETVAHDRILTLFRQLSSGTTISSTGHLIGNCSPSITFSVPASAAVGYSVPGRFLQDTGGNDAVFTLGSGSVRRLRPGTRVDLYAQGSATKIIGDLYVDVTDEFEGTFKLLVSTLASATTTTISTSTVLDLVIPNSGRDSTTSNLPTALDEIITNSTGSSGTPYGIDFGTYPQFKSYVAAGVEFTEQMLFRELGTYIGARGRDIPDTFAATPGVWVRYFTTISNNASFYRWTQQGKPIDFKNLGPAALADNEAGFQFNAYGRVFDLIADPWLAGGFPDTDSTASGNVMYGLTTRNRNFKMKAPPRLPGSKTRAPVDNSIQFLSGVLLPGASSIFLPSMAASNFHIYSATGAATASGVGYTNFMEAPFYCLYEIVPDVIPGMKLTGMTEAYGNPT